MIGLTAEQVLTCMGAPAQTAKQGATEVWNYPSGGQIDSFGTTSAYGQGSGTLTTTGSNGFYSGQAYGSSFSSGVSAARYCVVNVVITSGRVTAVNYQGRTGGLLTEGEQCAYAVSNCVRQTPTPAASTPPATLASTSSNSSDAVQAFVSWCKSVDPSSSAGCDCMPDAMKEEGVSDQWLRAMLTTAGVLTGPAPAIAPGRSDEFNRAIRRCGLQ
jgi:hypothetical protein